jgi:hypothetical protein
VLADQGEYTGRGAAGRSPFPLSSRLPWRAVGAVDLPAASRGRNDTAKIAMDARPGGPTAKRQPSPEGWEIDPEQDPSAVGAALNRSSALPVSLGAKPTCPGAPWRNLQFRGPTLEM